MEANMVKLLKRLSILIVIIFLFINCGGFQVSLKTDLLSENIFSTTDPNFKIKIDDEFVYVGEFKEQKRPYKSKWSPRIAFDHAYFVWEKGISRILIHTVTLPFATYNYEDSKLFLNRKLVIKERRENLGGRVWRTGFVSFGKLNHNIALLNFYNIGMSDKMFSKIWAKQAMKKFQINIYYIEIIDFDEGIVTPDIAKQSLEADHIGNLLTDNERADAAITIIE